MFRHFEGVERLSTPACYRSFTDSNLSPWNIPATKMGDHHPLNYQHTDSDRTQNKICHFGPSSQPLHGTWKCSKTTHWPKMTWEIHASNHMLNGHLRGELKKSLFDTANTSRLCLHWDHIETKPSKLHKIAAQMTKDSSLLWKRLNIFLPEINNY